MKQPFRAVFFLPLLLLSCSAPDSRLHADASKLRPWSPDLASEQPLPPPFVADFESGARSLCYAAVDDRADDDNSSIDLLRQLMDSRHYGVVVLEGIPRSLGESPQQPAEGAARDGSNGYYLHEETAAAIERAVAKKVPYVGAEPDEDQVKGAVAKAGYTLQDLFGLYVLRLVPQWRQDGTFGHNNFDKLYGPAGRGIGRRLGMSAKDVPTAEQFQKWYEIKQGAPFQLSEVTAEAVAPNPSGSLFSQKLATVIDHVRGESILRVTEEMLNRYGHVLLVFHGEHYPVQEPALEAMLGRPTRISDSP